MKIATFILCLTFCLSAFAQEEVVYWPGGSICEIEKYSSSTTFFEDFDGTDLDRTVWQTFFPCEDTSSDECFFSRTHANPCSCNCDCDGTNTDGNSHECGEEIQIYQDDNVVLNGDGTCSILVKKENATWQCKSSLFTSGVIHTKTPVQGFGEYKIRCNMPDGDKFWPNFWMFGWGLEFDVAEFFGKDDQYHPHFHNFRDGHVSQGSTIKSDKCLTCSMQVYSIEYEPYRVKYLLNNEVVWILHRFSTIGGKPIIGCEELKPQMLKVNPVFPSHIGSVYNIIADVSLQPGVDPNSFQEDELRIDFISFRRKDIPCSDFNASYVVEEDRTWSGGKDFTSLTIEKDVTVTLQDGLYNFDFAGIIQMEPGSKLKIKNATLTACDTAIGWTGINARSHKSIELDEGYIKYDRIGSSLTEAASTALVLFPNPARDFIKIRYLDEVNKVEVLSMDYKHQNCDFFLDENILEVSTSQLSSGIYYLKVLDGNGVVQIMKFCKL